MRHFRWMHSTCLQLERIQKRNLQPRREGCSKGIFPSTDSSDPVLTCASFHQPAQNLGGDYYAELSVSANPAQNER
jgi:hypothetical protein